MNRNHQIKLFSVFLVSFFYLMLIYIYVNQLFLISIDSIFPGFGDIMPLTKCAECLKNNVNPYTSFTNSTSIICNYPRFTFVFLNFFGIDEHNFKFFSFLLTISFIVLSLFLVVSYSSKNVVIASIFLMSPPIVFLLERSNLDLFIFLLLLMVFHFLRKIKSNLIVIYFTYFIVLFVSLMKFYPVILLLLVFIEKSLSKKSKIIVFLICTSIFLFYNILHWDDLKFILSKIPGPTELAFGRKVFIQEFIPSAYVSIISFIPFLFFIFMIFYLDKVKGKTVHFQNNNFKSKTGLIFLVGALIYVLSFLLSNNYDYRLVFLLFTLPYFFENRNENIFKKVNYFYIVIVILFCSSLHRYFLPFQNYIQWFIGRNILVSIKYLLTTFLASYFSYCILILINDIFKQFKLKQNTTL
jgi:hypothetical protein